MAEFQELSDVELNADKYYQELCNEEALMKEQLDGHLKLNKEMTEEVVQLESKLEVVTKNTELLGVDDLKKKLDALNQMMKEVEEHNTRLIEETIQYSSQMAVSIGSESRRLEDMRKAYSNPEVVKNSLKTATVQCDQAQQTLDGLEKEMNMLKIQQSSFQSRVCKHDLQMMDWILGDLKKQTEQIKMKGANK